MNQSEIVEIILKASPAEETEVFILAEDQSLTRFANNSIHQNVTETDVLVTVRSVTDTRVGIAVSNDTRRESLPGLAARAHELAKLQPRNPEFNGLPDPRPLPAVNAFDAGTAECSPEMRASIAGVICRKAAGTGCIAAGSVTTAAIHTCVANSRGVFAEHRTTAADCSTVIMGNDSSGWAQASGWKLDAIAAEQLGDEALGKVRLGTDPSDFAPGEYTVILDPYAAADLLEMLAFDGMGALSVQEGRSWMNGRIGQKAMAGIVTIVDDGLDTSGLPMPFDYEGVPKGPVSIVESGVVKGPVFDTFTAGREIGKVSSGHATPPSPAARYGPLPMNLFLRPGATDLETMIRTTEFGLYITRFWYTRPVHPRDAVVTGMTRDGTFVVRNGEIAHPVKSLRFTQSYVEALHEAESIGSRPRVLRTGYGTAVSVPAVKLAKFRFTSSTR